MWFWASLTGVLLLSRLCHVNILWADEDYHLAAAIQMLHGKMLYRDLWYDKPPLSAMVALLFGAWPGWPLRIAASLLAAASCARSVPFRVRPMEPARRILGRRITGIFADLLPAGGDHSTRAGHA